MRKSLFLVLLSAASCTGSIGDQTMDPGAGGGPGAGGMSGAPGGARTGGMSGSGAGGAPSVTPAGPAPTLDLLDRDTGPVGAAPLRRLNRREYNNVVRDLVGDTSRPADAWTTEAALSGFDTDVAGQAIGPSQVEQFLAAAEQVARTAVTNIATVAGCDPAAIGEEACGAAFIDRFGSRAYRRPLEAEQKTRLQAVFAHGRRTGGFPHGVRLVVETVLQSPYFLYRVELGEKGATGGRVPLTGPELASRLSFFLLGTMPDSALRTAADSGALRTTVGIEREARRLLARSDAKRIVASFHHQWLELERLDGLTKDPVLFPGFGSKVINSMEAGTDALVQHLYVERADAAIAELLTAPYAFVDANTAKTYGLTTVPTKLERVAITQPRSGLLTDSALMTALAGATETNPVSRGAFVRARLFCSPPTPPPDELMVEVPKPDPKLTTRERFAAHRASPTCAGCHAMIDPIGFGFENYDAVGRYRTTENSKPIDASGELVGTLGSDGRFVGAVQLGQKLAKSPEVHRCIVDRWMTFALGRPTGAEETSTIDTLAGWLGGPQGRLRELLVAIARSPGFRHRPATVTEVCR